MNTRKIKYIESDNDFLQEEVDWAVKQSMEQRFLAYCKHIAANYAVAGIDIRTFPLKRKIYYIEDER